MNELSLDDIVDLRAYERQRDDFRKTVIALKKLRRVALGPLVTVVFENRTTIRFQVQEMARAENMLSDTQVQTELDVYNPLIPGPGELSMTLFVELTSEADLRRWLPRLVGIERSVAVRVGAETVRASVDPAHEAQLTRDETTASVHYVRIALPPELASRILDQPVELLLEHPEYRHGVLLGEETKASLTADWED